MAVPKPGILFDEIAANQSRTSPLDVSGYGMKAFAVKTTGFTGTLNLGGQHYRGQSDWRALRYRTLTPGSGNPSAPSDAAPAYVADTGYRILLCSDPWDVVSATVTGYAAGTLTVTYLMSDVEFSDINSSGPGAGASSGVLADKSIASLTGATQVLMAANLSRSYWFIKNVGTAEIWFNFGVAAVAAAPSIRLVPGEWQDSGQFVSTQAINIIGTALQSVTAKEG